MKQLGIILFTILFISCTEEIDIPITSTNSNIVVQGFIEKDSIAKILLTENFPINQPYTTQDLLQSTITDAEVIITSNDTIDTLTLGFGFSDTWAYNYLGTKLKGYEGGSYLLEIKRGDDYISATTTIPEFTPIITDSIEYIMRPTSEGDPAEGCYAYLRLPIADADTIGNCWQISSKRCWDISYTQMAGGERGLYNDEYINGWSTKIDIYPGVGYWATYDEEDDNSDAEASDCFETFVDGCSGATDAFWSIGETFDLKFSSIDRESWDFWISLLNNNPGSPFGSPSQAKSNINGGFGVFSGMSSKKYRLTIPLDLTIEPIE